MSFNRTYGSSEHFSPSGTIHKTNFVLQKSDVCQTPAQTDTSCKHRRRDAVVERSVQFAEHQHCTVFLSEDTEHRRLLEQAGESLISAQL